MSGDDFGNADAFELLDENRRRDVAHLHRVAEKWNWGVLKATHDFAREKGAVLQTSYLIGPEGSTIHTSARNRCYQFPCWYMVKPYASLPHGNVPSGEFRAGTRAALHRKYP